jgi:hypothetical protein
MKLKGDSLSIVFIVKLEENFVKSSVSYDIFSISQLHVIFRFIHDLKGFFLC